MNIIKIAGMMDPHVHLRSMEWSHKGTFATETAAALAGGYTLILDMPNTQPSTINRAALDRKLAEISGQARCDWGVYFGASQSDNTAEFVDAFPHVCGLKIYCNATTGDLLVEDQTLRRRIYEAWPRGKVISVHAEGETVRQILELVRTMGKRTHFCHISTAEEIRYLRAAKTEGLLISVGVCPHHLYLTEDDLPHLGGFGLMKPELKTTRDQAALWEAVQDGTVDIIESDHAPHGLAEKQSEKSPYGVPGLETTLPLMLRAAKESRISLDHAIDLVAENPRRIFHAPCPPDTYALIDLDANWKVSNESLHSACGWSPFAGMNVVGRVMEVYIRGMKVFDRASGAMAEPGFGQNAFEGRA